MKNVKQIKILVSSPTDLNTERDIIDEIIDEINLDRGKNEGFILSPIKWETHARPGQGQEPQAQINEAIGYDCDIYLGMLGNRFGTPTQNFGSGTEEEFSLALRAKEETGSPQEVFFYFKEGDVSVNDIDIEQLANVRSFKKTLKENKVLFWPFKSEEDFRLVVRRHISRGLTDILKMPDTASKEVSLNEVGAQSETFNPIANFENAETVPVEDGFIELVEQAEESFEELNAGLETVASALGIMATNIGKRTDEIIAITAQSSASNHKMVKRQVNGVAKDMERYISTAASLLPSIHANMSNALDISQRAILIGEESLQISDSDRNELKVSILTFAAAIPDALRQITDLTDSVVGLPPLSVSLKKATRRVAAINADTVEILKRGLSQAEKMIGLLE